MTPGSSDEQIARLLQANYQWKNLNPFEVLQLGTGVYMFF